MCGRVQASSEKYARSWSFRWFWAAVKGYGCWEASPSLLQEQHALPMLSHLSRPSHENLATSYLDSFARSTIQEDSWKLHTGLPSYPEDLASAVLSFGRPAPLLLYCILPGVLRSQSCSSPPFTASISHSPSSFSFPLQICCLRNLPNHHPFYNQPTINLFVLPFL